MSIWAHQEEESGHCLNRWDLFRQFKALVQHKHDVLAEIAQERELSDAEQKCLDFASKRLQSWQSTKPREKAAYKLLGQTGFRERQTNRRTSLSKDQEKAAMERAWAFFDFINWLVPNGSTMELADFFAQPEQFRLNYLDTILLWTDQIPVWLKVEAGTQLISEKQLRAARAGQKQRRVRRQAAAACVAAQGQPAQEEAAEAG